MKSWILFSLVLITKLSLPLTVTSVQVKTLTLYWQKNPQQPAHMKQLLKPQEKQIKSNQTKQTKQQQQTINPTKPARYPDPSYFVGAFFPFLSVYLWTSWCSQGAAKVVSKGYCAISSSKWKKCQEELEERLALLQATGILCRPVASQAIGLGRRQLGDVSGDCSFPCHESKMFLSFSIFIPIDYRAQRLQDLASSTPTPQTSFMSRAFFCNVEESSISFHHRVFEGEACQLGGLPVTANRGYIDIYLDSMRHSSETSLHIHMAVC